jgi:hypothetical protein
MADDLNDDMEKALDRFTGKGGASAGNPQGNAEAEGFPAEFEALKLSVIRPAFERIGTRLQARGHAFNVSEEGTKISLHIVPAGVSKSIHPYDWFPTFTFFAAPFTKSIGTQARNTRPNSDSGSGSRGDYTPAQLTTEMVEKQLMKFIAEIANWT